MVFIEWQVGQSSIRHANAHLSQIQLKSPEFSGHEVQPVDWARPVGFAQYTKNLRNMQEESPQAVQRSL